MSRAGCKMYHLLQVRARKTPKTHCRGKVSGRGGWTADTKEPETGQMCTEDIMTQFTS